MKNPLIFLFSALCSAAFLVLPAPGQKALGFILPGGSSNIDGNSGSTFPFNARSNFLFQQAYATSEFASLTNFGGGWIKNVFFRVDRTNGFQFGGTIPSIRVSLSTTSNSVDSLSQVIAENHGADYMDVFPLGPLSIFGATAAPVSPFNIYIPMLPFFYDPSKGNLLMEIFINKGATNSVPPFDASDRVGDSVSRLYSFTGNSTTGIVDTVGLVAEFTIWPKPQLRIQQQTNSVLISWPTHPAGFNLQSTENLLPQCNWKSITTNITMGPDGLTANFLQPLDSAAKSQFFRLFAQQVTFPP